MDLTLYNTLSRTKEVFKPLHPSRVTLYTCGPTVYYYAHIGNLRAYVFADVLRNTLEYFGYTVKQIINITDIGHLTGDADECEELECKCCSRNCYGISVVAEDTIVTRN